MQNEETGGVSVWKNWNFFKQGMYSKLIDQKNVCYPYNILLAVFIVLFIKENMVWQVSILRMISCWNCVSGLKTNWIQEKWVYLGIFWKDCLYMYPLFAFWNSTDFFSHVLGTTQFKVWSYRNWVIVKNAPLEGVIVDEELVLFFC